MLESLFRFVFLRAFLLQRCHLAEAWLKQRTDLLDATRPNAGTNLV